MNCRTRRTSLRLAEPDHDQAKPKPPIKERAEVLHVI
jgi:hypothetical protein